MLILMQLIKMERVPNKDLEGWFISATNNGLQEIDEMARRYDKTLGIELTERQIESLQGLVLRGTWKAAFNICGL